MEIQLWWLLAVPLFFALGWIAARVDIRHVVRESRALPRSYFRGLNFLLNEQSDKAIEAFIEAVRVDPETIELHYALGNLFRRRGEADRAIRVHKNLVEREDLTEDQRLHAIENLGLDYLKAGLLDRAEEIFLRLTGTSRNEAALHNLLEVYSQEKEWGKAITIASSMPTHSEHLWALTIAQFHCEIASVEHLHGNTAGACAALDAAIKANRKCVRALALLGEIELAAGNLQAAIAAWRRIEQQSPEHLALVAEKIAAANEQAGQGVEGARLLRGYLTQYPSLDLLDVAFTAELKSHGAQAAFNLVRDELRRNPTLLGLDKLLEAQSLLSAPEHRADLDLVRNLIHQHTRRVARYRCTQCGFKSRQYPWRCPACGGWETYPPRRTEEYDIE